MVLSAFTHIFNPIGFPAYHVDEGHYMRRAMQVISGLGPQETNQTYDYGYDHPFFGQIFLASCLSLLNYPDSLNPSIDKQSIENLFLVPRIIMGILAVVDTFLVYKIADTRYNKRVAFIASTLFAVMPLSTVLRGILLDSIGLPFILLSILFATYYSKSLKFRSLNGNITNKRTLLLLLSGIFFGLAIFTKVPVFTLIPLIAFILLEKHKSTLNLALTTRSKIKSLGIWLIPVMLIPIIWPAYAVSVGEFDDWLDGVLYQTGRQGDTDLYHSIMIVTQIDPILVILGIASIIYTAIRKDLFPLVWMLPYLIFLYLIGWVAYFHWSIFLPVLCIALGTLAESLSKRFMAHKFIRLFPFIFVSGIAILGLLSISFLFTSNLNATYTDVYFYVTQELHNNDAKPDHQGEGDKYGTTMIGSHRIRALVWIPKYVFADAVTFRDTDLPNDNFTKPIQTVKFLLVADSNLLNKFAQMNPDEKYSKIASLYYNTSQTVASFIDQKEFKNNLLNLRENHGLGTFIEIKANY